MSPSPKSSPKPSHNMEGKYAILMETNGEEFESWYYFIKIEGNEENLKHLQEQLEQVEWYVLDELSTFDLELDYPVSAITAKEMTKVDLNATSFHRKFDGRLQRIDLDFKSKDGTETKMCKTFDILGYGSIDDFISDEETELPLIKFRWFRHRNPKTLINFKKKRRLKWLVKNTREDKKK